ncbi:hypothetical protein [Campylobacter sp. FOBRC14]|jgi:hypothetical protein|uniref:hypothetical protein n=1 Tax=Campylobacter sp. FOBRC14 TaxID=936554 RepID=UPI00027A34B6|nr:hypothetical protein [Campylobacter sp. FOBRC14]EJP75501.1 hypothetical protein HMPREF1139_0776 [Campylobacter sp. FOBRC14]
MLCTRAKEILELKSKSGLKLPENEILSELFLEAMLYVASKCVPSELIRGEADSEKVYRNIENGFFICYPDKPNFSDKNEHLMIDETLTYAVINEVIFLLNKDPFYRDLAIELIAQYNANDGREKEWI